MNKPQIAEEYIQSLYGDQLGLFTRDDLKMMRPKVCV